MDASSTSRPTTDDREQWNNYWKQQRQPWRTEPEITAERQAYLGEQSAIAPDLQVGIYPFGGIRLSRADIEWLLATHEDGKGPIDPDDAAQHDRLGLDLRGVDLGGVDLSPAGPPPLNLSIMPLAQTRFGLSFTEYAEASEVGRTKASANLQSANIFLTTLQSANLRDANLQNADLNGANLQNANLIDANLQNANLVRANLKNADLISANLQGAYLSQAELQSASLLYAHLQGVNLCLAKMDSLTDLTQMQIDATISVADVIWGGANLVNIDWSPVIHLADETTAHQRRDDDGKRKDHVTRLTDYRDAVRAYRLLTTTLRNQGMNEEADRFAYRAQVCQRAVFRLQGKRGQYLGSLFLDLLAGYGYRPSRTLLAYLLVILGFTVAYMVFGTINGHAFSFHEGIIFSLTSFHGRGFFPGGLALDDPITTIAAIEAVIGLLIEVSFIATFTQRFFAR